MKRGDSRILAEVLLLWVGGLLVLGGTNALASLGGILAENQAAIAAAYFLLVPVAVTRWRGEDPGGFGITGKGFLRSARIFAITAMLVFPPYVLAFEAWSRVLHGRPLHIPAFPLAAFTSDVRGRPDLSLDGLHVWVEDDVLFVLGTGKETAAIRIRGCGCPARSAEVLQGGGVRMAGTSGSCVPERLELTARAGRGKGVACNVDRASEVSVDVVGPMTPVYVGPLSTKRAASSLVFGRTRLWLLELLLLHLVVVALPEEVFYRGYVQTRLLPLFRRRWRILGAGMGWHVAAASALFALSHLVVIPSPVRLAVFFPGLLFGYLRERSGSVIAPALMHAFSNVLLAVLYRFH